ncbi:MAG TPA: hypothetical protein ENJ23_04785, partial [Bacteroidetes bacterium]|nr:hypothetical protein [Bacteroidota bacterium]
MFAYFGQMKFPAAIRAIVFGGLTVLLLGTPAGASGDAPVPRKILALYKSSEGRTEETNEIYEMAQLILNNLGFVVEYRDAEKPLPPIYDSGEYCGVLSWFVTDQMRGAERYRRWLGRVLDSGKKVVILGNFGALTRLGREPSRRDLHQSAQLMLRLGLRHQFLYYPNDGLQIEHLDARLYNYERTLTPKEIPGIFAVRSEDPANRVVLRLSQGNLRNDAAVIGSHGGFVQSGVIYFENRDTGLKQWYLNPYAFFSAAFGAESLPRLDLNTVNGLRTAFVHIDGDGFSTISKIDRWHLCAELFLSRIAKKFELPFSVSVIAAEVDPRYIGDGETVEAARALYRQHNVEAASHGFAHPFDWRTGKLELDSLDHYRFDPRQEILASVDFIRQELLPQWKNIRMFFWSGMCNPTEEQIALAEDSGLLQINGDAGRLWEALPSISSFAPPYAQTGRRFRINARVSNEYEFTNRWHGPYDGYRQVIRSFEFTDGQPPQVPADIYFHFYSLEYDGGYKALREVLKWAEHQNWSFVYTSQYVNMVRDFLGAKVYQPMPGRLVIQNSGAIRDLFIPDSSRTVDLARSSNILGFAREKGGLRVFLDSHDYHTVQLEKSAVRLSLPYLVRANVWIDSLTTRADTTSLFAMGYGNFRIRLAGMQPGKAYQVQLVSFPYLTTFVRRSGKAERFLREALQTSATTVKANPDGTVEFSGQGQNRTIIRVFPVSRGKYLLSRFRGVLLLITILFLIAGFL